MGCRVRTTTARTTSPFLTVPPVAASRTCAVMTSPMPASKLLPLPMTPIILAMRAPVLSATSIRVRIWSIKKGPENTLVFDDFNQTPALQFTERAGFRDADGVTQLGFAILVVNVELFDLFDDLAEFRMRHAGHSLDDRGFRHLGRNHLADAL